MISDGLQSHNNIAASLDALPYIDPVDDEYETMALSLVEEEMQHIPARHVDELKPIHFTTSLMAREYDERTQRDGPLEAAALASHMQSNSNELPDSPNLLQEIVKQSRVAHEKERLREAQLSAEKLESSTLWKTHVELLHQQHAVLQQRLELQRTLVEQVNSLRQQEQEGFGRELDRGARQFREMVAKRIVLQEAIAQLEDELKQNN